MPVFELVITLLLVGAVLAAFARRMNAPYPALLALAGAVLALLPNVPSVMLDPRLALTLFVAPVLLDAAFDSSPRDLKQNWRAVTGLALVAVGLTVVAVAVVARWMVPELSWPAAIALGAIVAPPDAAAATAVLRQLRAPHNVFVILEGESLFNDATALLTYRLAVAAALTGTFSGWSAIPMLAVVTAGSILLAAVLCRASLFLNSRIDDLSTAVISQFVSTFAVWMIAEGLGLSGIITMVVYAILVARTAPDQFPARLRIPSYAVWEVAVFVLNVLAFILVGLQLKPILQRLGHAELITYLGVAAAVTAAVVLVRIVWVMGYAAVGRWLVRPGSRRYPSFRTATVIAWCGMRGIVTLAAALALPARFPYRDLILFTAFSVVLATLVVQGMTVSPLMRTLRLQDDHTVEREVRLARAETARAGLAAMDGVASGNEMVRLLQQKYQARVDRAESGGAAAPDDGRGADYWGAVRRAQQAERRRLSDLRSRGVIGDDAFHRVEEELDFAEMNAEAMTRGE
ncbi:MAG TPA: sodium:proton antiporter [Gemmatimonadales bacterium]|jgi:CPA1 family monovalent cation:H+ antiporter|nr:sodium:proton antiporter [Gemmatimonadales bacterium]